MTDPTDPIADLRREADAALAVAPADELGGDPQTPAPAAVDPAQEAAENRAFLASLLKLTFNKALAPRLGKHWMLEEEECSSLADAYATLLDKYFPSWRGGPELTAAVVTFGVFGPRLATTYAQRAKENEASNERPAAAGDDDQA